MIVTCDECVYHIAREIKLIHPETIQRLGTMHGFVSYDEYCIGLFVQEPEGQWSSEDMEESSIFGDNVVENVMTGYHFKRS